MLEEHDQHNTCGKGCNLKERPIIIGADTVNLFMEMRKTQYRTPVHDAFRIGSLNEVTYYKEGVTDGTGRYFRYPFGPVKDRVWIREPFRPLGMQYKADGDRNAPEYTMAIGGWLPPVYMPRWASRLTMDIIDVRVETLQAISDTDCVAEGFDLFTFPEYWNRKVSDKTKHYASNPLVFVTEFRVI